MIFPLECLAEAIDGRAETWARLGFEWQHSPGNGWSVVESPDWMVHLAVWKTGETELSTIRLADDRGVNKHYDLTGPADLGRVLDDLVALIEHDRVPEAAVVYHYDPRS